MVIHSLAWAVLAVVLTGCAERQPESSAGDRGDSGVAGTVLLGPTCPVETPENPCKDLPPEAGTRVIVAERLPGEAYTAGEAVAEGTTQPDGSFTIDVAPGEYVLTAEAGMSCEILDVVVLPGQVTTMNLVCDTGIRAPVG